MFFSVIKVHSLFLIICISFMYEPVSMIYVPQHGEAVFNKMRIPLKPVDATFLK